MKCWKISKGVIRSWK